MKKTITILAIFFALITNAQTYIPMPAGYTAGVPFYSHDGFIYCKAHLPSSVTGFPGVIFKVNETTNVVTQINGDVFSYDGLNPTDFQIYDGGIFFNVAGGVGKINLVSNSYTLTTNLSANNGFAVLNNKIFTNTTVYDIISQTYNQYIDPQNNNLTVTLENVKLHNNAVYGTRTLFNQGGTESTGQLFKILNYNSVQLLYTNPNNGYYDVFEDYKPIIFNNRLLYRFNKIMNNVTTTSVDSYDLNNNSINTIFNYASGFIQNSHYVFNNNIYFNNGNNQTLASNGFNLANLTNIPNILNIESGGFVFNTDFPVFGDSRRSNSILMNNNIFGCTSRFDSSIPANIYEIRKSDGTLSGTSLVYSSANAQLHSAITIGSSIYFFKYTAQGEFGELIRYNNLNQQATNIYNGALHSYLFKVNNSIFFLGTFNGVFGLHKLDTATLATPNFSQPQTFSIAPNPTNNILNIATQETIKTIKIIDKTGRNTNITNFENNKIDVSNLQIGIYFLEIATENGLQTQKFIKN